jgi:Family of unknown function (DUF6093)
MTFDPSPVLARARTAAESLMVDTCTIRHPSTRGALNNSTGVHAVTLGAVIYTGKCKRVAAGTMPSTVESGDRDVTQVRSEVRIPVSAKKPDGSPAVVPLGAVGTMDSCPHDPSAVGSTFRVDGHIERTWAKDIRLKVTEVQS